MIGRAKELAKRRWPRLRLRTILLFTFVFVAALPGVGAVFLRVYENTLVRQTEAELVAQSAAIAAAAETAWGGSEVPARLRPTDFRPEPPRIDLSETPILPERPAALPAEEPPDATALARAARLRPVLVRTSRTTLASIQLLDPEGRILAGVHPGRSYAQVPEVRAALQGRPITVLRHNGAYQQRYALEWLSRASDLRIHHVRPIMVDSKVAGALLLSRSPRSLFRGIYQDRGQILIGIGVIFATLVLLAGLLSRGIARPIEELSAATRGLAAGQGEVPEPPPTAAIEIQALYRDFGQMAESIDRRSRYLRDFAHAMSHEFKTPLAGIRGAIELLQDHHAGMAEEERQRFLANASADADRLAMLVSRLLELARADMARPGPGTVSPAGLLTDIAEDMRQPGLNIETDVAEGLPTVAVPRDVAEAVIKSLIENSRQAGAQLVRLRAGAEVGGVAIEVSDDGPGIPAADRERVFEPFFTSRRGEGGTGLGLPIARSLLEASRGSIELAEAERGACFRLRLPVAG